MLRDVARNDNLEHINKWWIF